jgi:porin
MRARRGVAGRLVFLVWAALCVFGARAYSQTGIGETLSGPDSHEVRQGPGGHLLGDWGGARTDLLGRGVRFDFQYISDTLWGFESQRAPQFASWNRVRATVDIDFGALAGQDG